MDDDNQFFAGPGTKFRMECDSVWMTTVVSALVWGIGLLLVVFLAAARGLLSVAFIAYAVIGFSAYMLIDYLWWIKRGIRVVEVDAGGINLYRGKRLLLTRIEGGQITGVNRFDKLGRVIVNIMLGGAVTRGPGVTLFSGPRLRITNDNFNNREFEQFVARAQKFAPDRAKKQGEQAHPPASPLPRI